MKAARLPRSGKKNIAEHSTVSPDNKPFRWRRAAINGFIVAHILIISCWAIPLNNSWRLAVRGFVTPYMRWTGLFQSWDMFSPVPKHVNSYVEAIIHYQDGNTRNWAFPRMAHLNVWERYSRERYRKYVDLLEATPALWPDAALFAARHNNDRTVPIKTVLLVRYCAPIALQGEVPTPSDSCDADVIYARPIRPSDLK